MARLGELLIDERLIAAAQLEEALEAQVVHGGRLGTNLVELGFLGEKDLARVLGKQHNVAFASGEMVPDPQALTVAEPNFLDDHDLVPMRVDATRLTVAVLHPGTQLQAIDALGFKVGKRVVPVVVPEFRLNQLLRKHFKAFRPLRPIDMNSIRPSARAKKPGEPAPLPAGDLINEDDFASLYAKEAAAEDDEETIEGVEVIDDPAVSAPRPRIIEPIGKLSSLLSSPEPAILPLTFAEAQALLAKSEDREDVARTVLRFAISKFRRALLLSVHGDMLTGWRGAGVGVREKAVRRIGVSLKEHSSFRLVRDARSHYVGPMTRGSGTALFYKLLGGGFPTTAVMMPLLVRGKPVHLLYVDQGAEELTPPDIGELLILSQSVARSYEAMISKRKAATASPR